ncbi:hypothetical protein E1B28_006063 [Marasmius oreades]|uniref:N-acetyltransferase domain-containing protein n=1 Tax=Marasmius oreades TaxID=181124 RepID=A0A9P7S4T8_9AGAR|nr:uncharacterized protein E1B28_006063 [Marasmius oreades]KAG7095295.1 hypothetical protein E1B28_006063 [Marasmius oreades]
MSSNSFRPCESLTLEEEYEMQRKWRVDEDKLTFIILARISEVQGVSGQLDPKDDTIRNLPMIGDVNLFLSDDLTSITTRGFSDEADGFTAEAEIMIAEPSYRRRGMAYEALQLMFRYATSRRSEYFSATSSPAVTSPSDLEFPSLPTPISPRSLLTRITESNEASIRLFQKLGFEVTKRVEVFGEVEMRWRQRS